MPRGKRAESNGQAAADAKKIADQAAANGGAEENGADEEAEHGPGHNSAAPRELTDDERASLTFTHKRAYTLALAVKKKADADLKNVCKLAKAELGDDAVPDIKSIIELETEEGEAKLKAEVERRIKVARWMGLPVGVTGNLFDAVDRTPAVDRATAKGKRDGLAGEPCRPNHDPSTPQYTGYMTGYQEGQKIMFAIKPMAPAASEQAEESGVEFDDLVPAEEPPTPETTLQ